MSRRSDDRDDAQAAAKPDHLGKQLNVLVSDHLHGALRAAAHTQGVSQAEIVRQALLAILEGRGEKVPAGTFSGSPRAARGAPEASGEEKVPAGTFSPSASSPPPTGAKMDAAAYQQLVRVGGNLNQALRAINSGRGEPDDWQTIVEAARAVIALKRHVAGLPPATPAEESAGITLRRVAVRAAGATTGSTTGSHTGPAPATPHDDGFSQVL